jgi:DNA processing protein
MDVDDDRAAWVALALVPGIGATRFHSLLQATGSPLGALSAPFAFLCTVPGMTKAAATAVTQATPDHGRRVLQALAQLNAHVLLPDDAGFPEILRQIPDQPNAIFALGKLELLEQPAVAIVGSRDHTAYGGSVCQMVATGAAQAGLAVVSGMARGLDAVAHSAALDVNGATIGVLGNGLGVIYPAANRELYEKVADRGLLLTEFPPGERPHVGYFPRRNRLISALARVTVVIEAAQGSGTLITVGTALAQGKDVMAVPGPITSPTSVGTNRLIRDGAEPLLELNDLLAHYGELAPAREVSPQTSLALSPEPPLDLTPTERLVFDQLAKGPIELDSLLSAIGVPVPEALAAISGLELRGLASQALGMLELQSNPAGSHR